MASVTVPELKAYLRLNDGSEDTMLAGFIVAAEAIISGVTGRTLDTNATTGFPTGVPEPLRVIVKLVASHYYAKRELTTDNPIDPLPLGFLSVCRLYSTKYVSPGVL